MRWRRWCQIQAAQAGVPLAKRKSLMRLIDVEQAHASSPNDRERILADVKASPGGPSAVNTVARGAVAGAWYGMQYIEVFRAACGFPDALLNISDPDWRDASLCAAAAGGFLSPLKTLLDMGADPHAVGMSAA